LSRARRSSSFQRCDNAASVHAQSLHPGETKTKKTMTKPHNESRGRRPSSVLLLSAALLGAAACDRPGDAAPAPPDPLALADSFVADYFAQFPHTASLSGASAADWSRLPDNSLDAWDRWRRKERDYLGQARRIHPGSIDDPAARVTFGFLRSWLENAVAWQACRMELWNVSPTYTGWISEFSLLASVQPVSTEAERLTALRRFSQLPGWLDREIETLREGLRLGYSAPRVNVETVIGQMDDLLEADVGDSPFVRMAPDDAPDFRASLEELEVEQIRPAIRRYRDFLAVEYLPRAREAVGVSANPDGEVCYRAAIRYHATVDISPEEVHEIGLREMATIHAEMRRIGERSFGTDDVPALLQTLKTDPRYLFRTRQEIVERAEAAVARARAAVPEWFGIVPRAEVVVRPYPPFQEQSAPGGFYNPPAEDGSRPGIYLINTYQPETQPIAGLESTAFHETYPGHHLQGAIALERPDLHPLSRYFYLSGFGEGWGLYSERLADEMGLYSSDVDRMGMLSAEAHRAARLVVDTGLHALGWTRRQAIDYLLANTALSEPLATAEIDRYIAVPGQATSYMLGALEIRRLRRLAEARFGADFDIRSFHDRVLEDGPVPLSMLAEKIERWSQGR